MRRHLDGPLVGGKSCRIRLSRVYLAVNHSPITEKNELKLWQHEQRYIPPVDEEFIAPVEDVLDLYEEEFAPATVELFVHIW